MNSNKGLKVMLVINPISGNGKHGKYIPLIEKLQEENEWVLEMYQTEYAGHCKQLAQKAKLEYFDIFIVCGGDGTVNEACQELVGSKVKLAIIPAGSGNGLSNCLGIPKYEAGLHKMLSELSFRTIDTLLVNDKICTGLAGLGFDGHVAALFANLKTRGIKTYVKLAIQEYHKYKAEKVVIHAGTVNIECKPLLVAIANSDQFGNFARISPDSIPDDGIMEICILEKFPWYSAPFLASRLFRGKINKSHFLRIISATEVHIENPNLLPLHLDGEPAGNPENIVVKIAPSSLQIIVPKN